METGFELSERLAADTLPVLDLELCTVRLMKDKRYPWLILIPRIAGVTELIDLETDAQIQLMAEIAAASQALKDETACHKLNVAALGNMVPQLHIHVVARFREDTAWPGPIWGVGTAEPYGDGAAEAVIAAIQKRLQDLV